MKKIITLLSIICLSWSSMFAQCTFVKPCQATNAATAGWAMASAMCTDRQDNIILSGGFSGSINFGNGPDLSGIGGAYIVKYSPSGIPVWNKKIQPSSTGGVGVWDTSADKDDNIYITGVYQGAISIGSFSVSAPFGNEIFFLKLDSSGVVKWLKSSYGNTSTPDVKSGHAIDSDSSGNVYFAASANSNMVLDTFSVSVQGGQHCIGKLDSSGAAQWIRRGTYGDNLMPMMKADAAGNMYLSGLNGWGTLIDTVQLSTPPQGKTYSFIARFNSNDAFAWAKEITGDVTIMTMDKDSSDRFYVAGTFNDTITVANSSLYSTNKLSFFVAAFDTAGNLVSLSKLGTGITPGTNMVVTTDGLDIDAAGNLYLSGYFSGDVNFNGQVKSTLPSVNTFFTAKYDTLFSLVWVKDYGVASLKTLIGAQHAGLSTYTYGYFKDNIAIGGNYLVQLDNSYDLFLVEIDKSGNICGNTSGIENKFVSGNNSLAVSGNTAYIDLVQASGSRKLSVYSVLGQEIAEYPLTEMAGRVEIEMPFPVPGVYIVVLTDGEHNSM